MNARQWLFFGFMLIGFWQITAQSAETDSYFQQFKRAISSKAGSATRYTLEQFGINTEGISNVIDRIKRHTAEIHKEVEILKRVMNQSPGPITQMQKVVQATQQLKQHAAILLHGQEHKKYKGISNLIREADELLLKIDQLQPNPLLKPVRHVLLSFADLFEDVLLLRGYFGKLGSYMISEQVMTLLENGIYDLRVLGSNLFDLITGGRRKLQDARAEMVKYIVVNRGNIPKLAEQLSTLQSSTLPNIQIFLTSLAEITQLVVPMVELGYDWRKAYEQRLEARRKESYFRFVGPYGRVREITSILTELRDDVYALLRYANNAILAITNIVEIAVERIVKGFDEQLNFKIFKQRADRAARSIPPNARSLHRNIDELQKVFNKQ